jgi:hypothetical protein
MSKIKIQVTRTDIGEAKQNDPYACMVWRAVTRNLQLETGTGAEPVQVSVDYDDITFNGRGGSIAVKLPEGVGEKIEDWDEDKTTVEPFSFDINLPSNWREQVTDINLGKGQFYRLNADGSVYDEGEDNDF